MLKIRFQNTSYEGKVKDVRTGTLPRVEFNEKELLRQYFAMKRLIIGLGGTIYGGWEPEYNEWTGSLRMDTKYSKCDFTYDWDDEGELPIVTEFLDIYFEFKVDIPVDRAKYIRYLVNKEDELTFKVTKITQLEEEI